MRLTRRSRVLDPPGSVAVYECRETPSSIYSRFERECDRIRLIGTKDEAQLLLAQHSGSPRGFARATPASRILAASRCIRSVERRDRHRRHRFDVQLPGFGAVNLNESGGTVLLQ